MKEFITSSGTKIIRIIGGRSNVFLISGGNHQLLVDTGPGFQGKRLIRELQARLKHKLDYLILTHTHFDHAANAGLIESYYNPCILVHRDEAVFLKTGDSPLPYGTNPLTSWMVRNFGKSVAGKVKYQGVNRLQSISFTTDLSDTGINVQLIPTPGHTMGSMSVVVDREIALVGDTIFGVIPGRCYPPFADNQAELIKSWEVLLNTGCRLFLPSHGNAVSDVTLKKCLKSRMIKT